MKIGKRVIKQRIELLNQEKIKHLEKRKVLWNIGGGLYQTNQDESEKKKISSHERENLSKPSSVSIVSSMS